MTIVVIVLAAALILQTILHAMERRDLYNRIMARDLSEYEQSKTRKPSTKHKQTNNWFRKNMKTSWQQHTGIKIDDE